MSKPRIGFIGLGLMGSAMAQRLLSLGYPLTTIANRSRANIDAAVAAGATEASTARDVAAASDIVMLCMGTSDQVESRIRFEVVVRGDVVEGLVQTRGGDVDRDRVIAGHTLIGQTEVIEDDVHIRDRSDVTDDFPQGSTVEVQANFGLVTRQ